MNLREFVTKWGFDVDDEGLKKLDASINNIEKGLDRAADKAIKMGKSLSLRVTLPLLAIGGATIKAASDAEETNSKFATVFGNISDSADATARNLSKSFGLSRVASKQLLGDTGDLLTGFGFTQDSALDLSDKVNQLAVDLASFTNFSGGAEGASKALTKALLGERESVKSLGISILEEDVKKQLQIQRSQGLTFETERQAKAYATLTLAQKQSKNAIGDYARTSESFANRTRRLRARVNDLAVSFGEILLPFANKVVGFLEKAIEALDLLTPGMKRIIIVVAGFAAALGPLLLLSGLFIKSMLAIKSALTLLSITGLKSFAVLALPFLKVIAIAALVILVLDDIIGYFQGRDSVTGVMVAEFTKFFDFLSGKFMAMPNLVKRMVALMLQPFRIFFSVLRGIAGALGALSGGSTKLAIEALKGIGADIANPLVNPESSTLSQTLGLSSASSVPVRSTAAAGGTQNTTNQNVTAPITINVPEGTATDQVGPAVQKGVKEGIADLLRQTQRQTTGAVVN